MSSDTQTNHNINQENGSPHPQPPVCNLNALKHGLTAKTLIVSLCQVPLYEKCLATVVDFYQPVTDMEKMIVQEIADTTWRLQRASVYESSIFAKGRVEASNLFQNMVPDDQREFIVDAHTQHVYSKTLTNLSLQQQRSQRTLEKKVKEFETMRDDRELVEQTRRDIVAETLLGATLEPLSPLVDSVFSRPFLKAREKFKKDHPTTPLRIIDLAWGDPKAKTLT